MQWKKCFIYFINKINVPVCLRYRFSHRLFLLLLYWMSLFLSTAQNRFLAETPVVLVVVVELQFEFSEAVRSPKHAQLSTESHQQNVQSCISSQTKWSTSFHQRVKFLWQSNRIQTALKVMMEQRKVMINHDKVVFFSERPNTLILQQCWEEAQLEQQSWTPRLLH